MRAAPLDVYGSERKRKELQKRTVYTRGFFPKSLPQLFALRFGPDTSNTHPFRPTGMRRRTSPLALIALLAWVAVGGVLLVEGADAKAQSLSSSGDVADADDDALWPRILWAQRRHVLYIKLVVQELRPNTVSIVANDTHLTFEARGRGGEWLLPPPHNTRDNDAHTTKK